MPSSGYYFVNWSGDLTDGGDTISIVMTCDKEVTAIFSQIIYDLTVSVNPSDGGEVIVKSPQPAEGHIVGTEVILTAIASEGYEFSHWSGALSGSENPTTIVMDSGKELSASFTGVSSFAWWWIVVGVAAIGLLLIYFLAIRRSGLQEK